MTKAYSLQLLDLVKHPVLFPVAADVSLCGLKSVWKKRKRSVKISKPIFITNLDFQLCNYFDHHSLFHKIGRCFLHDSANTWEVPSLDPVSDDGSSDVLDTDLGAALDYLSFCFSGKKQGFAVMSIHFFHLQHQV